MQTRPVRISSVNRDPILSFGSNDFVIISDASWWPAIPQRVKLIKASIPYVWTNVSASNNTLTLTEGATSYPVTLTANYYNGDTLAAELTTKLNAAGGSNTYTVAYDATAFKFTITATGNFSLEFDPQLAPLFGFSSAATPVGTSTTSTQIAILVPDGEVQVCSDLIGGHDNGVIQLPQDATATNVLANVQLNVCRGNYVFYGGCSCSPSYPITQSDYATCVDGRIDRVAPRQMRFYLRLPSGMPLDLGGANWSLELLFEF